MNINKISQEINKNAKEKGFWEKNFNVSEKLMLIVSEIAEAQEADRIDKYADITDVINICTVQDDKLYKQNFELHIKNSFQDELADAAIRIFDLAFHMGIDLEAHIDLKHRYNKLREHKHGKKY